MLCMIAMCFFVDFDNFSAGKLHFLKSLFSQKYVLCIFASFGGKY
jgi:hypothetical protein